MIVEKGKMWERGRHAVCSMRYSVCENALYRMLVMEERYFVGHLVELWCPASKNPEASAKAE
jgi:hypothetical protein